MKTLSITKKEKKENGTWVWFDISDNGVVIEQGERLVPTGFDRLLIPSSGGVALTSYL